MRCFRLIGFALLLLAATPALAEISAEIELKSDDRFRGRSLSDGQPLRADFTLKAHAGLLTQTSGPLRLGGKRLRFDPRVAIVRPVLGLEAEVAWTFAGPDDRYFADTWDGRSAIAFSLSKHF